MKFHSTLSLLCAFLSAVADAAIDTDAYADGQQQQQQQQDAAVPPDFDAEEIKMKTTVAMTTTMTAPGRMLRWDDYSPPTWMSGSSSSKSMMSMMSMSSMSMMRMSSRKSLSSSSSSSLSMMKMMKKKASKKKHLPSPNKKQDDRLVTFPSKGIIADSILYPMVVGQSDGCVSVLSNTLACNVWMNGYAVGIYYNGYLADGVGDVEPTACCAKDEYNMKAIQKNCYPTTNGIRSCVDKAPAPGAYVLINGANQQRGENLAYCCPF